MRNEKGFACKRKLVVQPKSAYLLQCKVVCAGVNCATGSAVFVGTINKRDYTGMSFRKYYPLAEMMPRNLLNVVTLVNSTECNRKYILNSTEKLRNQKKIHVV